MDASKVNLDSTNPAQRPLASPPPPSGTREDRGPKPNGHVPGVLLYLNAPVDGRHADLIVVATCFITGLVDTVMFSGGSPL